MPGTKATCDATMGSVQLRCLTARRRTLPRPTGSNMMRIAASTDNAGAAGASTRGAGAGFGCQCGAIVDEVASLICCSAPASGSSSIAMRSLQDMELWMLCTNAARDNISLEPLVAYFKASRTVCNCVQPRTELLRNLSANLNRSHSSRCINRVSNSSVNPQNKCFIVLC